MAGFTRLLKLVCCSSLSSHFRSILPLCRSPFEFHFADFNPIPKTRFSDIRDIGRETFLLGQGQYGDVYKKKHLQSGVILAEKVVRKRQDQSRDFDVLLSFQAYVSRDLGLATP